MTDITSEKPAGQQQRKGLSDKQKDIIQKFAALGSLVILAAVFAVTSSAFLTVNNGMTIALQVTSIALLGIGATYVIITGGIDLSVGSVLALAGVVAALAVKDLGTPIWLGMLLGILTGALCGLINGVVITRLKLPPFIATLGMMLIARGVALQITGARAVSGLGEPSAFSATARCSAWRASMNRAFRSSPSPAFPIRWC